MSKDLYRGELRCQPCLDPWLPVASKDAGHQSGVEDGTARPVRAVDTLSAPKPPWRRSPGGTLKAWLPLPMLILVAVLYVYTLSRFNSVMTAAINEVAILKQRVTIMEAKFGIKWEKEWK